MAQEETRKKKTGMARCLELASQHKGLVFISGILAAAAAVCSFLPYLSIYFIMRELIGVFPDMANANKGAALFVGGVLFGSAGFKLLSSKDAKKAYTHMTAAALRVQESVMETVTSVQENAADILASAKEINEQRAKAEEATSVECSEA